MMLWCNHIPCIVERSPRFHYFRCELCFDFDASVQFLTLKKQPSSQAQKLFLYVGLPWHCTVRGPWPQALFPGSKDMTQYVHMRLIFCEKMQLIVMFAHHQSPGSSQNSPPTSRRNGSSGCLGVVSCFYTMYIIVHIMNLYLRFLKNSITVERCSTRLDGSTAWASAHKLGQSPSVTTKPRRAIPLHELPCWLERPSAP
jgi:hypothetical protein